MDSVSLGYLTHKRPTEVAHPTCSALCEMPAGKSKLPDGGTRQRSWHSTGEGPARDPSLCLTSCASWGKSPKHLPWDTERIKMRYAAEALSRCLAHRNPSANDYLFVVLINQISARLLRK